MYTNFKLNQVVLKDHNFALRRNLAKQYILEFDVNRLMHNFRVNAGISSTAEPLSGWEAPDCDLRGHFVGHFLSACSKLAFAEEDGQLANKANEIVSIMEVCGKPNGYLSAFEEEKLDILEKEEDRNVWAPYYTLHKILQGLLDCHCYLGNQAALHLAVNLAHYIQKRLDKLSHWKIDGMLRCTRLNPVNEFGGIGDTLYSLYELTKEKEILELAKIFDRNYFIDELANGQDILEDLHANTHLPMILSAMHRYQITGEEKYKRAALHFYPYLKERTFANGISSSKAVHYVKGQTSETSEHWGAYGMLGDALTGGESESCCGHNTEKILSQIFQWTGSIEYLEHMEILKFNGILNCASAKTGLSQYHQPMGMRVHKKFSGLQDTFWCCTGSGLEAMSEVQQNIWFKDKDAILLNAFISSTVIWEEKQVTISQCTEYPDQLTSTLLIETTAPIEFSLVLKEKGIKAVTLNSQPVDYRKEDGYLIICRTFHNQDSVEIQIDAPLHTVMLKGSDRLHARMQGNILLARLEEKVGEDKWIPLYQIEDEMYSVYLPISE